MVDEKEKAGAQERQHYRISYPVQERPLFECLGKKYVIIDVSEKGLAFHFKADDAIALATRPLTGRIAFKSGDIVSVAGKILRHTEDTVILILQTGVPLAVIMKEQRYLLQKYGQISG